MELRNKLSAEAWRLTEDAFDLATLNERETRFTIGNGYVGTRGSLEENIRGGLKGTFLAGLFNRHDALTTEMVQLPDWLSLKVFCGGQLLAVDSTKVLDYQRILDLRLGLLYRNTRFEDAQGRITRLETLRFASFHRLHLCVLQARVTTENHEERIWIESGVDGDVFNLGEQPVSGPKEYQGRKKTPAARWDHYTKTRHLSPVGQHVENGACYLEMGVIGSQKTLGCATAFLCECAPDQRHLKREPRRMNHGVAYSPRRGQPQSFTKLITFHDNRLQPGLDLQSSCLGELAEAEAEGFETLLSGHSAVWDQKWDLCDIQIEGDEEGQKAVRFNIYHMLIAANQEDDHTSVGAKTLSGEGYKGHVFWDTEIFILPFFTYTQPEIARTLLTYRYHALEAARQNAKKNGCQGSQFPWESADAGEEAAPEWLPNFSMRIHTAREELHVTANVAYGICHYHEVTGDLGFMKEFGLPVLFETARFWVSRLDYDEKNDHYGLNNVIGPDELHEHINNSAYTNHLVKWNLVTARDWHRRALAEFPEVANQILQDLRLSADEVEKWEEVAEKIVLKAPDHDGLIEQFDGYFNLKDTPITEYNQHEMPVFPKGYRYYTAHETQLVKQADVVMLLYQFGDDFDPACKKRNFEYYEARTMHMSSLSPAIYSIMGIEVGDTQKAHRYFRRSAFVDLHNNQGNTMHGIHAASTGGTWQNVVCGFGGMRPRQGLLSFNPWLPPAWKALSFSILWKGVRLNIKITPDDIAIQRPGNEIEDKIPVYARDQLIEV